MRTLFLSVVALVSVLASGQSPADQKDWIQLFNGKNLDGWVPKITGYALGDNYGDTFRVVNGVLQASYDKYSNFESKFGHLFYERQKFLALHHRRRVPLRRRAGGWRPGVGDPQQRPDAAQPGAAVDGEGSGLSHLGRGPAPRWPPEREAAVDRQHVLARHTGLHRRDDGEGALSEFEVADVRGRPVGARRSGGARRRAPDAQGRRADRPRVRQADHWRRRSQQIRRRPSRWTGRSSPRGTSRSRARATRPSSGRSSS